MSGRSEARINRERRIAEARTVVAEIVRLRRIEQTRAEAMTILMSRGSNRTCRTISWR